MDAVQFRGFVHALQRYDVIGAIGGRIDPQETCGRCSWG